MEQKDNDGIVGPPLKQIILRYAKSLLLYPDNIFTMKHRLVVLFVLTLLLILPVAATPEKLSMVIYPDSDYIPVIYATSDDDYSYVSPAIPLVDAKIFSGFVETPPDEWEYEDVILLNGIEYDDAIFLETGYSGDIQYSGGCCLEDSPVQGDIGNNLLFSALFSVMDMRYYLNELDYYLVDLSDEPIAIKDSDPTANYRDDGSGDQYFQLYVPEGKQHLWIDLSWVDSDMGYKLSIFPPDATMGPFDDSADGRIDQRIYLDISASKNLSPGMWYYTVKNLNGGYSNFNFTNYF